MTYAGSPGRTAGMSVEPPALRPFGERRFVALDEDPRRHAGAVQEPGEAVPVLPVHEDDLRGGVGEDVLQPFVWIGEVQGYVRAPGGDGGDQGDDLFHGARDGDGDPPPGSDPRPRAALWPTCSWLRPVRRT